jgi:lysophospholipase L1-like esterase
MTGSRLRNCLAPLLLVCLGVASSLDVLAARGEQWIATWGTAQQLTATNAQGGPGGRTNVPPPPAVGVTPLGGAPVAPLQSTPAVPPQAPARGGRGPAPTPGPAVGPPRAYLPPTFEDQTIRMIVRVSVGGRRVRVSLSNMLGADPLEIGAARIGLHRGDGAVTPGTDREITVNGQRSFTVAAGALTVSDPLTLDVPALAELAVSLYLPTTTGPPTNHPVSLQTAYIAKGNHVASERVPAETTTTAYLWLSNVDVEAPDDAFTVVALGDSITDGFATTHGKNRAWPTLLAERLAANRRTRRVAVINQGISGNQVLRSGAGLSMLARLDRDVLSRPGARWAILLGGINDINFRGRPGSTTPLTPEELIGGYRQIITRCHGRGIKVMGATLTPQEGLSVATERSEQVRQAVNRWIRTSGEFDAVVDFDAALRVPSNPARLRAEFNPGDFLHPNDLGNQAMADAFDLNAFLR